MELPSELNRDMDDWQIKDALMYEYEDLWEPLEKKATELTREQMGLDVDLTDLLSTRPSSPSKTGWTTWPAERWPGGSAGSTRPSRMSPSDREGMWTCVYPSTAPMADATNDMVSWSRVMNSKKCISMRLVSGATGNDNTVRSLRPSEMPCIS